MKKINKIIVFFVIIFFTFLVFKVYEKVDETFLHGNDYTLQITEWDKKKSKKEIYSSIEKIAKKNKQDIHKLVIVNNGNRSSKGVIERKIFTFNGLENKEKKSRYDTKGFSPKVKNHYFKSSKLDTEDVRGIYYLNHPSEQMKSEIEALGLVVFGMKTDKISVVVDYLINTNLYMLLFILLFISFLSFLYTTMSSLKEFGINSLLGVSKIKFLSVNLFKTLLFFISAVGVVFTGLLIYLFFYNSLSQIIPFYLLLMLVLSCLFIYFVLSQVVTFFICNYNGEINAKIKGNKPYALINGINLFVKIIILVALLTIGMRSLSVLTGFTESLYAAKNWDNQKDYYIAEFAPYDVDEKKLPDLLKQLDPIFSFSEEKGSILTKNNAMYNSNESDFNFYNGNVLFINNNYLEDNIILSENNEVLKHLEMTDNQLYLLIPEQYKSIENNLKHSLDEWIKFQNPEISQKKFTIYPIFTRSKQKIFNYNYRMELDKSFSIDPVVVVIDYSIVSSPSSFYFAAATNAQFLFSDAEGLKKMIDQNELADEIVGITAIKDQVNQKIYDMKLSFSIQLTVFLLILAIYILVLNFLTAIYCEKNAKLNVLQYTFGYSFYKRHSIYLVTNLLISLSLMILFYLLSPFQEKLILILFLAITELIVCVSLILMKEGQFKVTILKNK